MQTRRHLILQVLLNSIKEQVAVARQSLLHAAATRPLYPTLQCIRYILADQDLKYVWISHIFKLKYCTTSVPMGTYLFGLMKDFRSFLAVITQSSRWYLSLKHFILVFSFKDTVWINKIKLFELIMYRRFFLQITWRSKDLERISCNIGECMLWSGNDCFSSC